MKIIHIKDVNWADEIDFSSLKIMTDKDYTIFINNINQLIQEFGREAIFSLSIGTNEEIEITLNEYKNMMTTNAKDITDEEARILENILSTKVVGINIFLDDEWINSIKEDLRDSSNNRI